MLKKTVRLVKAVMKPFCARGLCFFLPYILNSGLIKKFSSQLIVRKLANMLQLLILKVAVITSTLDFPDFFSTIIMYVS